jgi:hypothetical protein
MVCALNEESIYSIGTSRNPEVFLNRGLPHFHSARTKIQSSLHVGDGHKGPLNNRGKPTYLRKKQNANEPKTRVR